MECRICHQQISFIRGRFPERRKTATIAVHESELPGLLQQTNSTVVTPHPGAQRKLRQELEDQHRRTAAPASDNHTEAASAAYAESGAAAEDVREDARDENEQQNEQPAVRASVFG